MQSSFYMFIFGRRAPIVVTTICFVKGKLNINCYIMFFVKLPAFNGMQQIYIYIFHLFMK